MAHNEPGPLRIGNLARKSGVSRDTLRFYERRGLLPKTQRTAGGFRVYPRETVDRLCIPKIPLDSGACSTMDTGLNGGLLLPGSGRH